MFTPIDKNNIVKEVTRSARRAESIIRATMLAAQEQTPKQTQYYDALRYVSRRGVEVKRIIYGSKSTINKAIEVLSQRNVFEPAFCRTKEVGKKTLRMMILDDRILYFSVLSDKKADPIFLCTENKLVIGAFIKIFDREYSTANRIA